MKNFLYVVFVIITTSASINSNIGFASYSVTIKNCYSKTLHFSSSQSTELLPSFHKTFPVAKQKEYSSKLVPPQIYPNTNIESYFHVAASGESKVSAFFGISFNPNQKTININGYLDQDLAYSWSKGNNVVITFCSPNDYKNNSCIDC